MKLGKHPARHDPRTLKLSHYLRPKLPAPKPAVDWSHRVADWGMLLNHTLDDCTLAAAGHMIDLWTSSAKTLSDKEIIAAYQTVGGYDPGHPATDRGAVELDVLKYWRKTGIGGHHILGFASIEIVDSNQLKLATELFGGCYLGLALPLSAKKEAALWSVPPGGAQGDGAPGSLGGHAVSVVAYDAQGLTIVTWGATKRMTWSFWQTYCDEAYVLLSSEWLNHAGVNPEGVALDQLTADLEAL